VKEKNKGPKNTLAKKKHKRGDADAEIAATVAAATERAERGVGVCIGDHLTVEESFGGECNCNTLKF
jgi:hypothetical protein